MKYIKCDNHRISMDKILAYYSIHYDKDDYRIIFDFPGFKTYLSFKFKKEMDKFLEELDKQLNVVEVTNQPKIREDLKQSIYDLGLSARAVNALSADRYRNKKYRDTNGILRKMELVDIVKYDRRELKRIRSFGKTCFIEVEKMLAKKGLWMDMSDNEIEQLTN